MVVRVRYEAVSTFARQLGNVPRELRKELRPHIRTAAQKLQAKVQQNASWSSRIPAATKVKVSFASRSGGVTVYVDSNAAPHARPLEFGSQGRSNVNRHPVFGNRGVWVDQPARPFFMNAARESEPQVVNEIQKAIDAALGRL